jgi:hypothetical protein
MYKPTHKELWEQLIIARVIMLSTCLDDLVLEAPRVGDESAKETYQDICEGARGTTH